MRRKQISEQKPTPTPRLKRRYSVGEWYGKVFTRLDSGERRKLAELQFQTKKDRAVMICPFRKDVNQEPVCTKEGGVCTLRRYESDLTSGAVMPVGPLITTCPNRFQEKGTIYKWVGETLLGHSSPLVLSQIGFLEQDIDEDAVATSSEDVGRIDSVLVHPSSSSFTWCAMEMQAVYFSGSSMKKEFEALRLSSKAELLFPAAQRRPDFRSSGPKRLMPQLQIKVPTLRRWGKKMAVIVDRSFFDSLGKMEEIKDVSNCDIAWFVVRYDENGAIASLK